jgi:hypothetical protein
MTSAVAGRSVDFGSADYDAIERAVMETPRGRWFLAQRDQRLRMGETQRILDALKRLEGVLVAIPAQPVPVNGGKATAPESAAVETAAQSLSTKNLKYFKQDEAVFTPAEPAAPKLAAVETVKPAAMPKPTEAPPVTRGARLIVNRISPPAAGALAAAAPAIEIEPAEPETPSSPIVEPGDKRRIIIIRHAVTEAMDIPLQSELAATPAS